MLIVRNSGGAGEGTTSVYDDLGYSQVETLWHTYFPWTLISAIVSAVLAIIVIAIIIKKIKAHKERFFCVTIGKDAKQVKRGSRLYPEIPEKEGRVFCGWYKDSAYSEPWRSKDKVKHDLTLYPKWSKEG